MDGINEPEGQPICPDKKIMLSRDPAELRGVSRSLETKFPSADQVATLKTCHALHD